MSEAGDLLPRARPLPDACVSPGRRPPADGNSAAEDHDEGCAINDHAKLDDTRDARALLRPRAGACQSGRPHRLVAGGEDRRPAGGLVTNPAFVAGIDVGGTWVRVGIVDRGGRMLASREAPTSTIAAERRIDALAAMIEDARNEAGVARLAAIGAGVTGQIEEAGGTIDNPFTLPGWHGLALGSTLRTRFGLPTVVENDVDAAALGEYWRGAGRDQARLYVVCIGTGVGTSLVLDGAVYRGARRLHPEGAHQVVDPSGPPCYCGLRGCLDQLVSGTAIERMARMAGGELKDLDGRGVAAAAQRGEPAAAAIMQEVGHWLAVGLVNVTMILAPTRILLGGGVMENFPLFAPTLEAALAKTDTLLPASGLDVAPCALGGAAAVVGAAFAAFSLIGKDQHVGIAD